MLSKKRGLIFILILLVLLLSNVVAAQVGEAFRNGLISINDFFANEGYKPFSKVIDFVFFSLIFLSLFTLGAKNVFKDYTRPVQIIVILFGLGLAFVFVIANISIANLIPYAWYLLYIFLFVFFYWLLGKLGMESKFWKFLLALLLLLLVILLLSGLRIREGETYFGSLSRMFKGISLAPPGVPGVPSQVQDLFKSAVPGAAPTPRAPITRPTAPAPEEGGIGGGGWTWIVVGILVALGSGIGIYNKVKKGREERERGREERERHGAVPPGAPPGTPATGAGRPGELTSEEFFQNILNKINEIKEIKTRILKKTYHIRERKKKYDNVLARAYKNRIKELSFVLDRNKPEYEIIRKEEEALTKLLKLERRLEKRLIELMKLENELTQFIQELTQNLTRYTTNAQFHARYPNFIQNINTVNLELKKLISKYFYIDKKEEEITQQLEELINPEKLEENIGPKWEQLKQKEEAKLRAYFIEEENIITPLRKALGQQIALLNWLSLSVEIFKEREESHESETPTQAPPVAEPEFKINSSIFPQDASNPNKRIEIGTEARLTIEIRGGKEPFSVRIVGFHEGARIYDKRLGGIGGLRFDHDITQILNEPGKYLFGVFMKDSEGKVAIGNRVNVYVKERGAPAAVAIERPSESIKTKIEITNMNPSEAFTEKGVLAGTEIYVEGVFSAEELIDLEYYLKKGIEVKGGEVIKGEVTINDEEKKFSFMISTQGISGYFDLYISPRRRSDKRSIQGTLLVNQKVKINPKETVVPSTKEITLQELLSQLKIGKRWEIYRIKNTNVYHIEFNNAEDDIQAFSRIVWFVEYSNGEILPKTVKLGAAHDIQSEDFARFYNEANRLEIELFDLEREIRNVLVSLGIVREHDNIYYPSEKPTAVITCTQDLEDKHRWSGLRKIVVMHEFIHGIYFTDEIFKNEARKFFMKEWSKLSDRKKQFIIELMGREYNFEHNEDLLIREFIAYFSDFDFLYENSKRKGTNLSEEWISLFKQWEIEIRKIFVEALYRASLQPPKEFQEPSLKEQFVTQTGFNNKASSVNFIGNRDLNEVIANDTTELEEIGGSFYEIADRMDYLIKKIHELQEERMKKRAKIFRKYGYDTDELHKVPGTTDDPKTDAGKIMEEIHKLSETPELIPGEAIIEFVRSLHTRGSQTCPFIACGEALSSSDYYIRNRNTKRELCINGTTSHLARVHHLLEKDNKYGISAKEFYQHFM